MDGWSSSTLWWIAAGVLVAAELATGTFYLLMLALGAAAAALGAHAGLPLSLQIVAASLIGGGGTFGWYLVRRRRLANSGPAEANPNVNIDIGQSLHVAAWNADGTARTLYRGASWAVRFAGEGMPTPGEHVIVSMHGSELRVRAATPRA
jgi:membrane protein implicated in regulation of membrane protease activity